MRIGELASHACINIQSIRFYERKALLRQPPRTSSGYRNYSQADLERIKFIKWCQPLGFTLKEVRELIPLHATLASLPSLHRSRPAELQKIIRIAQDKFASVPKKIQLLEAAGQQLHLAIKKLQNHAGPACPASNSAIKPKPPRRGADLISCPPTSNCLLPRAIAIARCERISQNHRKAVHRETSKKVLHNSRLRQPQDSP
jgi:MerR family mercuric resistance operon transcriptional regulator